MNSVFNKYYNDMENNDISFNEANKIQFEPLSDAVIKKYNPNANIITYDELEKYNTINELLPINNSFVYILFQSSPNYGHWTLLSKYNNSIIEYFDSYGGYIDEPLEWSLKNNDLLGQGKKYLSILLENAKNKDVIYNAYDFQDDKNNDIATCGRWCVLRNMTIKNNNMNLNEFIKMMKYLKSKTNDPYDVIVSDLINKN